MRRAALLLLLCAATAKAARPPRADPCAPQRQVFVSPAGEPFRAESGAAYPIAAWFGRADADHDGHIDAREFAADADRFFRLLDRSGDSQLWPDEIADYEVRIAPETSTYDSLRPLPRADRMRKRDALYDAHVGAARYGLFDVPEPVIAADLDADGAVTRAEFATAARANFARLGGGAPLAQDALPPTPQQAAQRACAALADKRR